MLTTADVAQLVGVAALWAAGDDEHSDTSTDTPRQTDPVVLPCTVTNV